MYEWAPFVCVLLSVFYSKEKFPFFFVLYLSHLFKADCIASPISREADNIRMADVVRQFVPLPATRA